MIQVSEKEFFELRDLLYDILVKDKVINGKNQDYILLEQGLSEVLNVNWIGAKI